VTAMLERALSEQGLALRGRTVEDMSLGEPTIEQVPVAEQLGPYRLVRRLGQGGMGVVHLATGPDGEQVAVKVLRPQVAHDPTARARLEREVSTLQRISHPGVAGVLDHDLYGDRPYLVTRYVPGPQLDELVEERGPLTPRKLLMTAGCLAESLQAIHAVGVVHRDLKPGNVLVHENRPVIIDFGIAQAADDLRITATGLVIGTPGYLAPELVAGEPVAASTDWWGWAATVTFAATGRRPFGTGPFEAVLHRVQSGQADLDGVDPRLAPLLAASLSPDRAERPTADEILRGLDRYSEGHAAFVPRESPTIVSPVRLPDTTRVMPVNGTKVLPESVPAHTGPTPEQVAALVPPLIPKRTRKPPKQAERATAYHAGLYQPPAYQPGAYQPVAYQPSAPPYQQHFQVPPAPAPAQQARPAVTSTRAGTLFSLLVALAAFAALAPALACIVTGLLIVVARLVDRTSTALLRRRQTRGGPGRSDGWVTTLASPVHLATSVLITIPCLILPLFMGAITGGFAAIGGAAAYGLDWHPLVAVASGVGAFIGLLTAWWGPGGSSLRRGSHSIARVAVRPVWLRAIVVASLLSVAMVCVYLVVTGVDTTWTPIGDPFDRSQLPDPPKLPDLPRINLPFIN
jgi:serine/threonine protein kinase